MKVTDMGETEGQLTVNLLSTEVNGENWRITCMQNWTGFEKPRYLYADFHICNQAVSHQRY